jgi:hypothetical protein
LEYSFSLKGGAVLGVGVACGHPARKDEDEGEGEEFTKTSVEEDIVGGEYALYFGDVVVLNAPIGGDLFGTPNVQEGLGASLRIVVYSDMGRHDGSD